MYHQDDPIFKMPPVNPCDYIVDLWFKVGISGKGANGATPLTWQEVKAFDYFRPLDSFEAESLIMMSREYCAGLNMTKQSDREPYRKVLTAEEWEAREKSIEMLLEPKQLSP